MNSLLARSNLQTRCSLSAGLNYPLRFPAYTSLDNVGQCECKYLKHESRVLAISCRRGVPICVFVGVLVQKVWSAGGLGSGRVTTSMGIPRGMLCL